MGACLLIAVASAHAQDCPRIAAISTQNTLLTREGPFLPEFAQLSQDAARVKASGNRLLMLATNGDLFGREGDLQPTWMLLAHNVKDFAVSGNRIAMIDATNTLWAYDGALAASPSWVYLSHDVRKVALTGQRVLMIDTGNTLWGREGGLLPEWGYLSHDASDVVASGTRIDMLAGQAVLEQTGTLRPEWTVAVSGGATKVALSGSRLAYVDTTGTLYARDTSSGAFSYLSHDVADVALDGTTILMRASNNDLSVRDGALQPSWTYLSHDIVAATVSHRPTTDTTCSTATSSVTAPLPGGARVMAVSTTNKLLGRDGAFLPEFWQTSADIKKVVSSGSRIVALATNGDVLARDGALQPTWTTLAHNAKDIAVEGQRVAIIDLTNTAYVYAGALQTMPSWTYLSHDARKVVLAGNRILMITTANDLQGIDNIGGTWVYLSHDVIDAAATDDRIAMVASNGTLNQRSGALLPQWTPVTSNLSNVRKVAVDHGRTAVIDSTNTLWARDGGSGDFSYLSHDAGDVALDGSNVLLRSTNNDLWARSGALQPQWTFLSHDISNTALAYVDVQAPTPSVSGGLYDARNAQAITDGSISVAANDDYSGVVRISLYADSAALPSWQRSCPGHACPTTSVGPWTSTLDPVALGWATGVHHLKLEVADQAGNVSTTTWDVSYYKTSWAYGGADHSVDTDVESGALLEAATGWTSQAAADTFISGLAPTERASFQASLDAPVADTSTTTAGPVEAPTASELAGLGSSPADDADAVATAAAGYPKRGCRLTHDVTAFKAHYVLFSKTVATLVMNGRFCWDQYKGTVWQSSAPSIFEPVAVETWYQAAGYQIQVGSTYSPWYTGCSGTCTNSYAGGEPAVAMAVAFDVNLCAANLASCITKARRVDVTFGRLSGYAEQHFFTRSASGAWHS